MAWKYSLKENIYLGSPDVSTQTNKALMKTHFLLLATPKHCVFVARIKDAQFQPATAWICTLSHAFLEGQFGLL